jgi:hypothetical protein
LGQPVPEHAAGEVIRMAGKVREVMTASPITVRVDKPRRGEAEA